MYNLSIGSYRAVLNKQKAAKVVWGLSGYLGNKDRDSSADQMSDSSSTNSGADSGSYASITNQRQENPVRLCLLLVFK